MFKHLLLTALLVPFLSHADGMTEQEFTYGVMAGTISTIEALDLDISATERGPITMNGSSKIKFALTNREYDLQNLPLKSNMVTVACQVGLEEVLIYKGLITREDLNDPSENQEEQLNTVMSMMLPDCLGHFIDFTYE